MSMSLRLVPNLRHLLQCSVCLAVTLFDAISDLRARLDGARVPTVQELLRSGYRRRPRGKVVAR
jgi:hypothetical protein